MKNVQSEKFNSIIQSCINHFDDIASIIYYTEK